MEEMDEDDEYKEESDKSEGKKEGVQNTAEANKEIDTDEDKDGSINPLFSKIYSTEQYIYITSRMATI